MNSSDIVSILRDRIQSSEDDMNFLLEKLEKMVISKRKMINQLNQEIKEINQLCGHFHFRINDYEVDREVKEYEEELQREDEEEELQREYEADYAGLEEGYGSD